MPESYLRVFLLRRWRRFSSFIRWWAWMFPVSAQSHRPTLFYFWFGIPFGLFIFGAEMTGNYAVVQWAFAGACITAAITIWLSLIVLSKAARNFWSCAAAVLIGLAIISTYRYLCPTVTVRPERVMYAVPDSRPQSISQTYRFRVQNKTDDDLYGISFLVRVHSRRFKLEDFVFDVPKSSWVPFNEETPMGNKFGDVYGMNCTDKKDQPVFLRGIRHLGPRDSREFSLTLLNPSAEKISPSAVLPPHISIPPSGGIVVTAVVSGFTPNSESLERPGMMLSPLKVPETLHCGAMSYLVIN